MGFKVFKINKYEPVEDERRLSEFAKKGEFIKFHFGGLAFFKKGEPKNMRYCIEASYLRAGGKKKRFYAENGWRLVCRGLDINIFSAEGNAVPLHTDRSEYAHIIKKFHRARIAEALILCIILLLSCAVPVIVMPISLQQGKNVYKVKIFSDSITTEELLRNIICAVQDYAA